MANQYEAERPGEAVYGVSAAPEAGTVDPGRLRDRRAAPLRGRDAAVAPRSIDQLVVARTAAEEIDHFRKFARLAGDLGVDTTYL